MVDPDEMKRLDRKMSSMWGGKGHNQVQSSDSFADEVESCEGSSMDQEVARNKEKVRRSILNPQGHSRQEDGPGEIEVPDIPLPFRMENNSRLSQPDVQPN